MLRPLDLLQPYRLEMGTQLANRQGKDLYAFWGPRIAEHLNERLAADRTPVVINLASQEYFKSVDQRRLKARVVDASSRSGRPAPAPRAIRGATRSSASSPSGHAA